MATTSNKYTWIIAALAVVAVFGCGMIAGRKIGRNAGTPAAEIGTVVTVADTVWIERHDTLFRTVARETIRHDTVVLAAVDTVVVRDSVRVEVPIERHSWTGDNWTVTASGFRVQLEGVWVRWPEVTTATTATVAARARWRDHWKAGVGVQVGYGLTGGGWSPYAGIGVTFGYWF